MAQLIINILLVFLLAVLLFTALRFPRARKPNDHPRTINDFLPSQYLQFREFQERLTEYNTLLQKIDAQKRNAAIAFLDAIRGDFFRLQHLLSAAAKFVPELTLEGEAHRFWLGVSFRWECRLARLQILLGMDTVGRFKGLTDKIRFLAGVADKALNEIARHQGLHSLELDLNS